MDIERILNFSKKGFSKVIRRLKRIKSLRREVDFLKKEAYRTESEFYKMFKALEYKLYETNKSTNLILYYEEIELNKIKYKRKDLFNPKISIIIPAYNASKYLDQAINSALSQTYKNIEIIVVNDGSNDDNKTEKVALSYGSKIKYIKKSNGGVSSALNEGIKNMTGEYFSWLSHDDLYYSTNIEEHINYLSSIRERDIVTFTNFDIIDENGNIRMNDTITCGLHCFDYKLTRIKPEYALLQGEINGCSVLINKKVFSEVGLFDETLRISQERDMWARIMKKYKFVNIPITTSSIRTHGEQVTNKNTNIAFESNKKRMQIIDDLSIETMIKLEGSEINFYSYMKNFYSNNNLKEMVEYINKRIENLNERNIK